MYKRQSNSSPYIFTVDYTDYYTTGLKNPNIPVVTPVSYTHLDVYKRQACVVYAVPFTVTVTFEAGAATPLTVFLPLTAGD